MTAEAANLDSVLVLVRQLQGEVAVLKAELAATKAELAATKAELAATKAELVATKTELAASRAEVAALKVELGRKDEKIVRLRETNEKFARMLFGAKSERFTDPVPDHPELTGFSALLKPEAVAVPPALTEVPAHKRSARREPSGRMELPAHLPREERIVDLPEADKFDPKTGEPLQLIGYEVSERLGYRSAWVVMVVKRAKYANPERPLAGVKTAPTPPCAVEKSLLDESFLAHLMVSKAVDHLPVERLSRILRREGIDLGRSTLNACFHDGCRVLAPLYEALVAEILACGYVHSDDTPVNMQAPGSGKVREGRFWGAVAGSGPPLTAYEFTCSREGRWPSLFFENFKGFLHADDYAGYKRLFARKGEDGVPDVVFIACWAHARRKFEECNSPVARAAAGVMLALIRRLYDIERQIAGLSPEERLRIRQAESRPLADAIFALAEETLRKETPQANLGRAAAYMLRLKEPLMHFLVHPQLRLDNNPVENAHRPVAVGRKNWLFVGNEECGQNLAVVMSLTTTCTKLGANPQEYLEDVLRRINDHPASKLRELLPDRWLADRKAAAAVTA